MSVTVENLENLERKVVLSLPWSEVNAAVEKQLRQTARRVRIDGFRPGKAPLHMVESMYGAGIQNDVLNELAQKAFYDVTQEIPANTKAREYASTQGNELTSAVIAQFADAQPMPNIPQMAEVWEPAATMFFDAASGAKDVKTATSEAVTAIKEAIEQKYSE